MAVVTLSGHVETNRSEETSPSIYDGAVSSLATEQLCFQSYLQSAMRNS